MTRDHLTDDLDVALSLADMADALSMARFRADDLVVDTKPDLTPVTEADRAVEQALRAELARTRPDDSILGEEYGSVGENAMSSSEWCPPRPGDAGGGPLADMART